MRVHRFVTLRFTMWSYRLAMMGAEGRGERVAARNCGWSSVYHRRMRGRTGAHNVAESPAPPTLARGLDTSPSAAPRREQPRPQGVQPCGQGRGAAGAAARGQWPWLWLLCAFPRPEFRTPERRPPGRACPECPEPPVPAWAFGAWTWCELQETRPRPALRCPAVPGASVGPAFDHLSPCQRRRNCPVNAWRVRQRAPLSLCPLRCRSPPNPQRQTGRGAPGDRRAACGGGRWLCHCAQLHGRRRLQRHGEQHASDSCVGQRLRRGQGGGGGGRALQVSRLGSARAPAATKMPRRCAHARSGSSALGAPRLSSWQGR